MLGGARMGKTSWWVREALGALNSTTPALSPYNAFDFWLEVTLSGMV